MSSFVQVESENVSYTKEEIKTKYVYDSIKTSTKVNEDGTKVYTSKPIKTEYNFKTDRKVPKLGKKNSFLTEKPGLMVVGW
jgi:myo-inositol-1-phosphate synthase